MYILRYFTYSNQPASIPAKHPEVLIFKNYTPRDLLPFNGKDSERILMGVNGSVYDVTQGRNFYGPGKKQSQSQSQSQSSNEERERILNRFFTIGSPYANFAGHDASRGLAKNSFDADMMVDPHGPIDKLEDLEADDWESLREWVINYD